MKDLLTNAREVEAQSRKGKQIRYNREQLSDTIATLCTALEAAQQRADRLFEENRAHAEHMDRQLQAAQVQIIDDRMNASKCMSVCDEQVAEAKAEVAELRKQREGLCDRIDADKQNWSRFHHVMKKHGLHPGRTDDDLIGILDAALEAAQTEREHLLQGWKCECSTEDACRFARERDAAQADAARLREECDQITEMNHAQWLALENCKALAARNRKEEWSQHILRFCADGGVVPNPLRSSINAARERDAAQADAAYLLDAAEAEPHASPRLVNACRSSRAAIAAQEKP